MCRLWGTLNVLASSLMLPLLDVIFLATEVPVTQLLSSGAAVEGVKAWLPPATSKSSQ